MADRRLDDPRRHSYVAGAVSGVCRVLGALVLVVATQGCAARSAPAPLPEGDAERVADRLERSARIPAPTRAVFEWELNDAGSRVSGRGVARIEPPYHARLDLFLDNGETAARAALVEDELRLPREVDRRLVPPAPLLWASLGVFRPGDGARLEGGRGGDGGEIRLRYALPDGRGLEYRIRESEIVGAALLRDGDAVERVEVLEAGDGAIPRRTRYRDLSAFRELSVSIEATERVEAYPPEIWDPRR